MNMYCIFVCIDVYSKHEEKKQNIVFPTFVFTLNRYSNNVYSVPSNVFDWV